MPASDGTGPLGPGPGTGCGLGFCQNVAWSGQRRGLGFKKDGE